MSAHKTLAFPGSRTVADWWRQLAFLQPQALWVGHLFLHRIEAAVRCSRPHKPDRFTRLILQAVALEAPGDSVQTLESLCGRLQLARGVLRGALRELVQQGLLVADSIGWRPSALGMQVVDQGECRRDEIERRVFYFWDPRMASAKLAGSPHFVPLSTPSAEPWSCAAPHSFDMALLHTTASQSLDWRKRHGFPLDVVEVLEPDPGAPSTIWERMPIDQGGHLIAALVRSLSTTLDEQFVGFAVRRESWTLQSQAPLLQLGAEWRDVFAELAEGPNHSDWRNSWRDWCQTRGIAANEADGCAVEATGARLRVRVSPRIVDHLQATRSEALKGDAWLLAGAGALRAAAALDLQPDR